MREQLSSPGDLLSAVLAPGGGRPVDWTVTQIDHSRTTVTYATKVEWADGSVTTETLGAVSGALPAGSGNSADSAD